MEVFIIELRVELVPNVLVRNAVLKLRLQKKVNLVSLDFNPLHLNKYSILSALRKIDFG